jgi:hypothetical protein
VSSRRFHITDRVPERRSSRKARQLEEKFGAVDAESQERVRKADAERLLDWGARLIKASRLRDVFGD